MIWRITELSNKMMVLKNSIFIVRKLQLPFLKVNRLGQEPMGPVLCRTFLVPLGPVLIGAFFVLLGPVLIGAFFTLLGPVLIRPY